MKKIKVVLQKNENKDTNTLEQIRKNFSGYEFEIVECEAEAYAETINDIFEKDKDKLLFTVQSGDKFSTEYINKLISKYEKANGDIGAVSGQKKFIWDKREIINTRLMKQSQYELKEIPDKLTGVLLDVGQVGDLRLNSKLKFDMDADFMLRFMLSNKVKVLEDVYYTVKEPDDSQYQCFTGIFYKEWYWDSINDFLLTLLREFRDKNIELPLYIQYYVMYSIQCRLDANQNNRHRHVLSSEEIEKYIKKISRTLKFINDEVIMNIHDYTAYSKNYQFNRMLLRMKYDVPFLSFQYEKERTTLGIEFKDELIYLSNKMRVNILFMDYVNGRLEIDASVPDIFSKEKVSYFFLMNEERYDVVFNEGYSLTKYFGISAYKRYTFHASIPVKNKKKQILSFVMKYQKKEYPIMPEYQSHTSRLSLYPVNSYWHFGEYLAENEKGNISISKYSFKKLAGKELRIWKELISAREMHTFKFFLLRFAYCMTRPFYKNKKIWMFYDKIYKGGDSAEYMYKYCRKKKDGIKKYYLMDKKAVDYKRLKKEGIRPLKRGSMKHRLVFLNADMMVVTNSTVFAFNDYYLENSRYIRGIPDFHVVCLQHGLSVQKIALAQQRLRDNTRLYFCASKYEIENLSQPVYNYEGYDALKLTGVPRYDGLINRDKKQILISPTWRMQSAMLVSKNEGVERDYNPNFKETAYYKVYNSLINDERLIDAAKKYGYRIAYVLHPIVSPQARDFDKNDYVDIIPSTGEMSYEDLFCESSLMVTDYSGVQFDFAYMRKPLIYHHHRDLEAHYEEGTFHYDTMAFGEITKDNDELIDLLCDYMKNGCKMKDEYKRRADDFFAFDDNKNCERIYDVMMKYQTDRIDKEKIIVK